MTQFYGSIKNASTMTLGAAFYIDFSSIVGHTKCNLLHLTEPPSRLYSFTQINN